MTSHCLVNNFKMLRRGPSSSTFNPTFNLNEQKIEREATTTGLQLPSSGEWGYKSLPLLPIHRILSFIHSPIKCPLNSPSCGIKDSHVNFDSLNLLIDWQLATGIPHFDVVSQPCTTWFEGKQTCQEFPKFTTYRASTSLALVYTDLCGLLPILSPD